MPKITTINANTTAWALSVDDVRLIRKSFDRAQPVFHVAPDLFYERLFYLAPSLRRHFSEDMREQKRRFGAMLAAIVRALDQPEMLIPLLEHLGERHSRCGLTAVHYQKVGEAFIWMLERVLADGLTQETEIAWKNAYDQLALVMQDAGSSMHRPMRAA